MLELDGVTKQFGRRTVLDQVTARFRPNAVHFLMGPNGAGKTTLIKCLLGLHRYRGSITWAGRAIDPSERVVCPVFDDPQWHGRLTGSQNIAMFIPEAARIERRYLSDHVLATRTGEYSHGQRMRLALTAAFNCGAELIILDEPTNGLDRDGMKQLARDLEELSSETTFIVTGHNLEFYENVIDTLHILQDAHLGEHDLTDTDEGGARLAEIYDQSYSTGP